MKNKSMKEDMSQSEDMPMSNGDDMGDDMPMDDWFDAKNKNNLNSRKRAGSYSGSFFVSKNDLVAVIIYCTVCSTVKVELSTTVAPGE